MTRNLLSSHTFPWTISFDSSSFEMDGESEGSRDTSSLGVADGSRDTSSLGLVDGSRGSESLGLDDGNTLVMFEGTSDCENDGDTDGISEVYAVGNAVTLEITSRFRICT